MSNSGIDLKVIRTATITLIGSITAIVGGGIYNTATSFVSTPKVEITNSKPAEVTSIPDYATTPKVTITKNTEVSSKEKDIHNLIVSKPIVPVSRVLPEKIVYHKVYTEPSVRPNWNNNQQDNIDTVTTPREVYRPTETYTPEREYEPVSKEATTYVTPKEVTTYVTPKVNTSQYTPNKPIKITPKIVTQQVTYTAPATVTYSDSQPTKESNNGGVKNTGETVNSQTVNTVNQTTSVSTIHIGSTN